MPNNRFGKCRIRRHSEAYGDICTGMILVCAEFLRTLKVAGEDTSSLCLAAEGTLATAPVSTQHTEHALMQLENPSGRAICGKDEHGRRE